MSNQGSVVQVGKRKRVRRARPAARTGMAGTVPRERALVLWGED